MKLFLSAGSGGGILEGLIAVRGGIIRRNYLHTLVDSFGSGETRLNLYKSGVTRVRER